MKKKLIIGLIIVLGLCTVLFFTQKTEVIFGTENKPDLVLTGERANEFIEHINKIRNPNLEDKDDNSYQHNILIKKSGSSISVNTIIDQIITINNVNYDLDVFDEWFSYFRTVDPFTDYQQYYNDYLSKGNGCAIRIYPDYKNTYFYIDGNYEISQLLDLLGDSIDGVSKLSERVTDYDIHYLNGKNYKYKLKKIEGTTNAFIFRCEDNIDVAIYARISENTLK